jgi:hypothetical protein
MRHVLFVHGTGVRQPSYDESWAIIAAQLRKKLPDSTLYRCYWGGTEGSRLRSGGASIPDYNTARAVEDVDPEDAAIAEWRLLYEDPDSELETSLIPSTPRDFNPFEEGPLETVTALLAVETETTRTLVDELRLQSVWEVAKSEMLTTLSAAVVANRAIPELTPEFRIVLARALVAHAITLRFADSDDVAAWPTGRQRDALVKSLSNDWGAEYRSVASWIGNRLKRVALKIGTDKVARKRGAVSDAAYPATGDILLYQARGEGIRAYIECAIQKAPKPVVVLAHSLGGIACVDLLASKHLDGVAKLITVGSQAPLFYELNALWSLPNGSPLPASFPDWLNIYDKHDFLSYVGAGLFPGRIRDVLVNNRQPFPQSHSAYWNNADVWSAIAGSLS